MWKVLKDERIDEMFKLDFIDEDVEELKEDAHVEIIQKDKKTGGIKDKLKELERQLAYKNVIIESMRNNIITTANDVVFKSNVEQAKIYDSLLLGDGMLKFA